MVARTATEITSNLIRLQREGGWRAEREAIFSPRRIDVLSISPGGLDVVAFEIKTSRQDFKNEIKNPSKRGAVEAFCTEFYFVCPVGLLDRDEIPAGCGLIYADGVLFSVSKYPPNKGQQLPIEIFSAAELSRREVELERYFAELLRCNEEREREYDECLEAMYHAEPPDALPGWMLPRRHKPLRFQFDVYDAASRLQACPPPLFNYDWDSVPF